MRLNVFETNKKKLTKEISDVNKKLAQRSPKRRSRLEISGIRIKYVTDDNDIVYQAFGKFKNISFVVNITRFWTNLIDDDIENIEACRNIYQLYALSQKAYTTRFF